MAAGPNSNVISQSQEEGEDGTISGITERDYGDVLHTTSYVTDSDGLSIRASYDTDNETGEFSGAHFHNNS